MIDEKKLIEELKFQINNCETYGHSDIYIDLEMARQMLSLLNQSKVGEWIPVDERLPKEKKFYEEIMRSPLCLVTVLSDDELMIGIDRTVNGVWTLEETFDKPKIIAWQPLQEPYSSGTRKNSKKS